MITIKNDDYVLQIFEDLKDCQNSMTFDSGTEIASLKDSHGNEVVVDVTGEVDVTYKGEEYFHSSDMPSELVEIFKDGNVDSLFYDDEKDFHVGMYNWFRIYKVGNENCDMVIELYEITWEDLFVTMREFLKEH